MNLLVNEQQELRTGWRFTTYWLLFAILLFGIVMAVPPATGPQTQLQRLVLNTIPLIPALAALILMARFVDHLPIAAFGLALHQRGLRDFLTGAGVSVGMLAGLTLINGTFGGIRMEWTAANAPASSLAVTAFVLVMSAAQEEIIFRGYPLQVLMKGIGTWPAILAMSFSFGLVHLLNPNATVVGAINTVIAGVMLSLAYLRTRSLWLPYGLHLGWNLGLGFVLGYPLSGITIDSVWRTVTGGPVWLVGSAYGPEGGIVGTVVFMAATAALSFLPGIIVSPQLRAVLAANADKIQISEK